MNHALLRTLAEYSLFILFPVLPFLVVVFTDRFRRQPEPREYAVLLAIIAVIGILLFLPAISVIAATALAALLLARLTARSTFGGVTCDRAIHPARLFPGDEADLRLQIDNAKLLPLASLTLTDPLHHGLVRPGKNLGDLLTFSGGVELLDDLGHALFVRTAMGPYQRLTRTYHVTAHRRGVYAFGPATMRSGDPFGLYTREKIVMGRQEFVVYPRVYRPEEIGLPFREAMGEVTARQALVEDPVLLAGSREYRPGDPLHRMHWKATARTGELQVRVADPSTTAQLMIVLNLNTFEHLWQGIDLDRMEAGIEVAASIALWALAKDFAVGIRSNGTVPGEEMAPRLPPAAGPRQPAAVLEHLARLTYSGRSTPEYILREEARHVGGGASIIFVTPIITPALIAALTGRGLRGRVSVVYCGRFAAPVVRGIPIYLATPPGEDLRAAG